MADYDEVEGYQNLQGSNTDYSTHSEHTVDAHGRGASLSDRKDQGTTRAPLDQAMPVSPYNGDPSFKY